MGTETKVYDDDDNDVNTTIIFTALHARDTVILCLLPVTSSTKYSYHGTHFYTE